MANLQELYRLRDGKLDEVQKMYDAMGEENPTQSQKESIKDANKFIEEYEVKIAEAEEDAKTRAAHDARMKERATPAYKAPFPGSDDAKNLKPGTEDARRAANNIADAFLENPAYKAWLASVSPSGHIPDSARIGQSPTIPVEGSVKALITGVSDTSAGALVQTQYYPTVEMPFRPLTIRDIITVGQTGTDLIEFARVTSQTNNAAPVAEATAASGGSGAKPESELALEKVTTSVKTIAHWMPATKRALADAGQIRTLINNFLRYGLMEELEDQILTGAGTGENFTGIYNTSGIQTQAYDTSILVTSRKARTKIKVTGDANPTAYVMHPNDWEDFDLLQDAEDRYYFGGPLVMGTPRLWGLPVVESEGATEGLALIGDFRQAVLWDREQVSITVSDSHSDFFIRNLVAILAEMRAAFGVLRPAAFCTIDLVA